MATQQLQLVNDSSTFANFYQWANAIDAWFAASGWLQSNDTGQWMRSGMSITAVSMSGTNMTCTYSGLTGATLVVGQVLTVTGWTGGNTGNNGTFVITSLGAGTWTGVNASGVNVASSGTGVVTAAAAAPGSGAYFNSFWKPNDSLTGFFVKMEYGNVSGTNAPSIKITISTSTNGTGTCTGTVMGPILTNASAYTASSTTTQYECNFSANGSGNQIAVMMWRNGLNACQQTFCIERSVNASGVHTSTHVTLVCAGTDGGPTPFSQQSLIFGTGVAPLSGNTNRAGSPTGGLIVKNPCYGSTTSTAFNGSIPFDTIAPHVGFFDYPLTTCGAANGTDIVEGVPFSITLYGASITYMPSKNGIFARAFNNNTTNGAFCMRYS